MILVDVWTIYWTIKFIIRASRVTKLYFFNLIFLSQPFKNHRTAEEGGKGFFNSSLPFPLASQTLSP